MKHNPMSMLLGREPKKHDFQLEDKVRAIHTQRYCMGQCFDDRIPARSVVTIDNFDENGWLFFKEHADRYGPWDPDEFVKVREQKPKSKKS